MTWTDWLIAPERPPLIPDCQPFDGMTAWHAKLLNEARFGWSLKVRSIGSYPEVIDGIFMGVTVLPTRGSTGGLFDREMNVRLSAGVSRHVSIDGVLDLEWGEEMFTCSRCDAWEPEGELMVVAYGPAFPERWAEEYYEQFEHYHDCLEGQ